RFRDHIDLYRDGELVFSDRTRITGNATEILGKMATGNGATAMVSLICAAPGAEQYLDAARRLLPETGGVTIPCRDLVHARLLAPDGFDLRRMLFPLLHVFRDAPLPRTWMI
ncbi:MAG: urease accessory protein UreD, partial [Pseudomonadota bacterium]